MLSECTHFTEEGNAFPGCTGIYSDKQLEGWKKVIEAVHKKNGRIFL
jgi:N-ethylmaleimide reductase